MLPRSLLADPPKRRCYDRARKVRTFAQAAFWSGVDLIPPSERVLGNKPRLLRWTKRDEMEALALDWTDPVREKRPQTRADCENGPRPCPWVACRHNLYLDVDEEGAIKITFPGLEPHEMRDSCALDVARDFPRQEDGTGGLTFQAVGERMHVTMQRAEQICAGGLVKVRRMLHVVSGEGRR